MSTAPNTIGLGWFSVPLTGVAATIGGAIASIANPEGADIIVTRALLYVKTNSTGAANLTIGVGTSATTDYSDMMTATAMAAAAGKIYTCSAYSASIATEVTAPGVWLAAEFCNVTGSATTAGLTGTLYVEYLRLT